MVDEQKKRPGADFFEAGRLSAKLRTKLQGLTLKQAETIFCDIIAVMEEKRRKETSQ